jgi:lactoylglutathione lyase
LKYCQKTVYNTKSKLLTGDQMEFIHVTLFVKDLEKSLEFYQGLLGLPIQRRLPGEHGPVFLGEEGKPVIELIGGRKDAEFKGFSIGFEVDSLDEASKKMEDAGCKLIRGPISPNPSIRYSFFPDPDGVEIQLAEYKR